MHRYAIRTSFYIPSSSCPFLLRICVLCQASCTLPFQLHCPESPPLPLFRLFPNPVLGHLESSYPRVDLENRCKCVLIAHIYGYSAIPSPARIRRSLLDLFSSLAANQCPATLNQRGLCLVLFPRLHIKMATGMATVTKH